MLTLRLCFAAAASAALLSSCGLRSLSLIEQKLVGAWDGSGGEFTERTVYRADHTFEAGTMDYGRFRPYRSGTWHVKDDVMIEEFRVHWQPAPGQRPQAEINQRHISDVTEDRLVYASDRPFFVRAR